MQSRAWLCRCCRRPRWSGPTTGPTTRECAPVPDRCRRLRGVRHLTAIARPPHRARNKWPRVASVRVACRDWFCSRWQSAELGGRIASTVTKCRVPNSREWVGSQPSAWDWPTCCSRDAQGHAKSRSSQPRVRHHVMTQDYGPIGRRIPMLPPKWTTADTRRMRFPTMNLRHPIGPPARPLAAAESAQRDAGLFTIIPRATRRRSSPSQNRRFRMIPN